MLSLSVGAEPPPTGLRSLIGAIDFGPMRPLGVVVLAAPKHETERFWIPSLGHGVGGARHSTSTKLESPSPAKYGCD